MVGADIRGSCNKFGDISKCRTLEKVKRLVLLYQCFVRYSVAVELKIKSAFIEKYVYTTEERTKVK